MNATKPIIEEEISRKMDVKQISLCSRSRFCIADFGSSTGRNSFPVVQTIINAIEKEIKKESDQKTLEFHVFFNDLVVNDFNTLFSSLPIERCYHAAGVPGPFHGRLFPENLIHFGHSSWSLQWLSEVPKAVSDKNSPAWNKGKIFYNGARKEVVDAYSSQFDKDLNSFLEARAQEIVGGGLLVFLLPGEPDSWDPQTSFVLSDLNSVLESCFTDMVDEGILAPEKLDSFNLPIYFPTMEELRTIIKRNGNYDIERMEIVNPWVHHSFHPPSAMALGCRVTFEGMLRKHFEIEDIDETYRRYENKLASSSLYASENDKTITPFVVLKRKKTNDI